MNNISAEDNKANKNKSDMSVSIALAVVLVFFIASGFLSYQNSTSIKQNALKLTHTHQVKMSLTAILNSIKDAETSQRGFLITKEEKYLDPYYNAHANIEDQIDRVQKLTSENSSQQSRIPVLRAHIESKLQEMEETINIARNKSFAEAQDIVASDRGKQYMENIRAHIAAMDNIETDLRQRRFVEMERSYYVSIISGTLTALLGVILATIVAYLLKRSSAIRQRQAWLKEGQVGLATSMLGNQRTEQLGNNILSFLARYVGAEAGAFFTTDGEGYKRISTYGVPADSNVVERFTLNDGLLGQAAKDAKTIKVSNVPEGYLAIGSALGKGKPNHLVISPAATDSVVNAVFELGFIKEVDTITADLLASFSEPIAIAIRSAHYRENLQNLLEETQRQSEELQAQGEELRVSNEELEEQSRALKETQSRLELQQAELEQTNTQLEEQTQLLEAQKEDLEEARTSIEAKANELEKSSQYKSDFLANMSHELRTPLNSSLILAKLLADNAEGNLTAEQVKFAQTIQSSGNDLLALINDILDLSKIEAGHMEVQPEELTIERLGNDINRNFDNVAKHKNLKFIITPEANCPIKIETDKLRLEQVLKNLISNAIKFTDKGSVELKISAPDKKHISFAVTDTGIGIASDQQHSIFEAFRQADGTISRKYGGTGLGLSISRELARLLGGSISLRSKPGHGSTFTLTIPQIYDAELVEAKTDHSNYEPDASIVPEAPAAPKPKHKVHKAVLDDREKLTGNRRVILIIEDDETFAQIIIDMAHELGFQCLVAATAEDALILAKQYLPNAVVLDVGLPDNSGLSVLDRLKSDVRTRHIPVHVISASDYTQTALSLGAVGYMVKPVKREQLVDTLKKLETKLAQRLRRVLIVEDDPIQQESVQKLLRSHNVETVGAGSAAETLEKLKEQNFDCMVLDLSLPDASGYSLLETLSREDAYSFPPVIVYTGRELSSDEEQRLRRYSKSIIIKGAKSPERLLDEVTLFLHQVVSELPADQQQMLEKARNRDAVLEKRRILVVEDDVANIYALTSILEPRGALVQIARNGREALEALEESKKTGKKIDLVLMDVMMPEVDGLTATRQIRSNSEWKKLPIIMLTAKAMRDDQERCLHAGANDYMAKPLDVEKLLSLVRVWMPR